MSQYYTPRKTKGLYVPASQEPFRLSRSKVDLFIECPRCFYFDRRLGVGRPPGYPFSLNAAVDHLLKKEFDGHRAKGSAHPLMKAYGIDAVPFAHPKMEEWRDALRRGVTSLHEPTNFLVCGGVDDIWVNPAGELIVVDYKATSKNGSSFTSGCCAGTDLRSRAPVTLSTATALPTGRRSTGSSSSMCR
jgi:hypothetical protein